ncbi:glycosyl transferase [Tamlana haliotis]|uniref:Glycosyl transferase n=1 Tax=Pseudotamlana haliotis TaxID=2614804 RepID=A0A6N6MRP4_9FLAO|nr:glycosyltransferase [Tamlana haliotis]KAB1071277.1 glycosyl transferase [Tamlana haliotis]
MISKKIHYCWLSGDEYPELIENCIKSWKKYLPDYELVLWDLNRFPLDKNIWVKQAFEAKKYAFAADYIRLYAVYTEGGIYLDGDIEVLKSFNELLHLPYFIGSEGHGIIEAGVFGAEKGTKWVKDCLDYYDNKSFVRKGGALNTLTLPKIMMQQIHKNHSVIELEKPIINDLSYSKYDLSLPMFPKDYFCAKDHGTGVIEKTVNTFCIHHFAMSWVPKERTRLPNIKRKMMSIFGVKTIDNFIKLFQLKKINSFFSKKQNQ